MTEVKKALKRDAIRFGGRTNPPDIEFIARVNQSVDIIATMVDDNDVYPTLGK